MTDKMKRIISLTIAVMIAIIGFAKSPNLACEKIFDRKELRTPGHDLVTVTNPGNIFRSVSADNDKDLQKAIKKAYDQDREKAYNIVEGYDNNNNQEYGILNISNNGCNISIGFYWNNDGFVKLFISGDPEAFK